MKARTHYACTDCGTTAPRWVGRCPGCGEGNTMVEEVETAPTKGLAVASAATEPVALTDISPAEGIHRSTGLDEVDRVLGGGLVPGSVTLLAGGAGGGKSPLGTPKPGT